MAILDKSRRHTKKDTKKEKKEMNKRVSKRVNDDSGSDDDDEYSIHSSEEEMDDHEYQKFLKKMFPSKYMDNKVKDGEKIKKMIQKEIKNSKKNKKSREVEDEEEYDDVDSDDSEEDVEKENVILSSKNKRASVSKSTKLGVKSKSKILSSKPKLNKKGKRVIEETEDEEEDDSEDIDDEELTDEDSDEIKGTKHGKSNKFNIIFTIGSKNDKYDDEDEDDEDIWEDDDDDDDDDNETENEDESVSDSDDDEPDYDPEDEECDDEDHEQDENDTIEPVKRSKRLSEKKSKSSLQSQTEDVENIIMSVTEKQEKGNPKNSVDNDKEFFAQLQEIYSKNKNSAMAKQYIEMAEESMKNMKQKQERKVEKTKERNTRIFRKIVRDKNTMNDYEFFAKLEVDNQKKIIKELREINKLTRVEKPYRLTLLEADMPALFKGTAMKKINTLRYMDPGSSEYYKIKNWVDTFMRIPFGKHESLPISINDGVDACHEFMENAKNTLDSAVYGLNDAKMQIMQMLGQLITNPAAIGSAIAIHGPMGTGKTSIVKEGISKILNRPFAFIALGGATDSSFLEGHSYTYEGSVWGKIVQILIDSKCMNPVIYFDELDKISDTPKGEEIAGILTHLTDTTQNTQFHDKYFAEVDFDLSKCLFIFSYNDEKKVNPILLDRMYRIKTKGYDKKQKTVICNNYLLPKIREQVKFNDSDIIIPDDSLQYIMETHCSGEDGVRNVKRCLEIIHTKLNLYRLMKSGSNLFDEQKTLVVEFPFTVTKEVVDKLIIKDRDDNISLRSLYV